MVAAPDIPAPALDDAIDSLIDTLQQADALHAQAARSLGDLMASGGVGLRRGLPIELLVRLAGRRTRWDADRLLAVADLLRRMPRTAAAVGNTQVSFSQATSIARAIASLGQAGRAAVDELVARRASVLASAEPEQLVWEVEDLAAALRDDLLARREQRAVDRNFLALQPRLEGGGSLYGQADAEAFAVISEALDAAAGPPEAADDADEEEPGSRARQRMDTLVGICEASLAGRVARDGASQSTTRPRPRFLVSLDLADPLGINAGARILARAAGHPVRISRLATQTMLCDAQVQAVVFDDGQPIGIGDIAQAVPAKVRAAVIARDGGCRFPGCVAPAGWADAHHLVPRPRGDNSVQNLILLCRRCHRRIHLRGWRLRFLADGTAEFRHRGRIYTSQPRARAPARE